MKSNENTPASANQNAATTRQVAIVTGLALIAMIAIARVLPHAANFAPAVAAGLLGGFVFRSRLNAIVVVLLGMLASDLLIGFESLGMRALVYGTLALPVILGRVLRGVDAEKSRLAFIGALVGTSLLSSVLFFIITNGAVWATSGMYSLDLSGLVLCYVNGIPFFKNAIAGDLFFSGVLFGAYFMATRSVTSREAATVRVRS